MKVFKVLFVMYFFIGAVFLLVHPTPDDTYELMSTRTGRHCDVHSGAALILMWPYYVKYYYGGDFEACLKTLTSGEPSDLPKPQ